MGTFAMKSVYITHTTLWLVCKLLQRRVLLQWPEPSLGRCGRSVAAWCLLLKTRNSLAVSGNCVSATQQPYALPSGMHCSRVHAVLTFVEPKRDKEKGHINNKE